jgi:hypothetical protein
VTDIGVPDPLEPEIDVIPAVDPVPGTVPVPEPRAGARARPSPRMTRREAVVAWRTWRLRIDPGTEVVEPRLESCVYGDAWPERRAFWSYCPEHVKPETTCSCGIYAVTTRKAALEWAGWAQSAVPNPIVPGRVQLWGRILPYSAGYRAELAYPYELGVLESERLSVADARRLERLLQAAYRVDITERAA